MLVRQCKIILLIGLAVFAFMVTFTNLSDNAETYEFIRHVMSMDTTFDDNDAIYRAVRAPMLWTIAYWLIVTGQGAVCLIYLLAAYRMIQALEAPAQEFQDSKALAMLATTVAFAVWFLAIMAIGSEWYLMWQSESWNGQSTSFRYYMTALAVLIVVMQPDSDLPRHRRRQRRPGGGGVRQTPPESDP
jgi:predicted small integral membrane protein